MREIREKEVMEGGDGKVVQDGNVLDLALDVNFAKGLGPRRLES
jgi:hypothetical protein